MTGEYIESDQPACSACKFSRSSARECVCVSVMNTMRGHAFVWLVIIVHAHAHLAVSRGVFEESCLEHTCPWMSDNVSSLNGVVPLMLRYVFEALFRMLRQRPQRHLLETRRLMKGAKLQKLRRAKLVGRCIYQAIQSHIFSSNKNELSQLSTIHWKIDHLLLNAHRRHTHKIQRCLFNSLFLLT